MGVISCCFKGIAFYANDDAGGWTSSSFRCALSDLSCSVQFFCTIQAALGLMKASDTVAAGAAEALRVFRRM